MANLGTLWFDSRLKDSVKKDADRIRKEILDKLKVDFDKDSFKNMVSHLRNELSKETFEIKIDANTKDAVRNLQRTLGGSPSSLVSKASLGNMDDLSDKIIIKEMPSRFKSLNDARDLMP